MTILSATQRSNVGTMLQPFEAMSQQYCNAVLRYRRYESSSVTSSLLMGLALPRRVSF